MRKFNCRVCGNKVKPYLNLGNQPLANNLLEKNEVGHEKFYPLEVAACPSCGLNQLTEVVNASEMFTTYSYVTSKNVGMVNHLKDFAEHINDQMNLRDKKVVDIGGNDGTLCKHFKNLGAQPINVDPSENLSKISLQEGIKTFKEYFSEETARKIGKASVITATNVFAHVDNLQSFINGVSLMLNNDSIFVFEVPHFMNLVLKGEFDTIYHEHLSYFLTHPLSLLFKKFNLSLFKIEELAVHGGSIRCYVGKKPEDGSVTKLHLKEISSGMYSFKTLLDLRLEIEINRRNLIKFLSTERKRGKRIVGYGAPAKATVLTNYYNLDNDIIEYAVDVSPFKIGKYIPGSHIPVVDEKVFHEDNPDYAILFPWNWKNELLSKEKDFKGKWIIPVPKLQVINH